ncbi:sulfatase [Thermostilla marina]
MVFRPRWLPACICAALCLVGEGTAVSDEPTEDVRRPNFIVFLMDDVGYGDIGVQGAKGFQTPNIDRMAAEGMRFTDFYVHPVCGVTRAALMTGCYAMRVGEVGNVKHQHPVLHPQEITVAELLKQAGYATALIGKWHLAGEHRPGTWPKELMPNAQGFDYWFGTPSHNGTTRTIEAGRYRAQLMRNMETLDPSIDQSEMDMLTRRYTQEAVTWIREHRDEPFFLYVAHNMAHVVLGASPEFRGSSDRGLYGDVMQELDWSLGEILNTLRELKIDRNTLVVLASDNGPWVEKHLAGKTPKDDHYGRATPLRGYKMTTWEGGVRVPCIFWMPQTVPAGVVCREPVAVFDLFPTFAAMAGAAIPGDRVIDGRDLTPLLTGRPGATSPHEAIYYYSFVHLQAVRSGRWKLVLPRPKNPPWTGWSARMQEAVPEPQLYDLVEDISEKHDVAAEHPEVVDRLMNLVDKARAELGDYDRIGPGQRFFEPGPRRSESRRWIQPKTPQAASR